MIYDVVPPGLLATRYQIRRWVASLPSRGFVIGNMAVLLCYNDKAPELSRLIVERI